MPAPAFTTSEIGAGRRLFAPEWRFVSAAGSAASLPAMKGNEIAFVGRSNVGKSSLINALTNRHGLARTSHTPGRTQELIFFTGAGPLTLVDMPGYGYAAAPKAKIAAWTGLIPFDPTILPVIGSFLHLGIWPLIMGVTMWVQMKLNPAPPDPAQKVIFDWMPVIFTFMLASFSAGLVIYWAWNNTLSVLQQSIIMKKHGAKIELFDNLKGLFSKKKLPKK